jgi:2-polyprenyl-6-methoxyphenol hydroxylase-like FAD-dependent oxidoreductase
VDFRKYDGGIQVDEQKILIAGAGMAGLFSALALARKGVDVVLITGRGKTGQFADVDLGPAHVIGAGATQSLQRHFPDLIAEISDRGAHFADYPADSPDQEDLQVLRCKRSLISSALWSKIEKEESVTLINDRVTEIVKCKDRKDEKKVAIRTANSGDFFSDLIVNAAGRRTFRGHEAREQVHRTKYPLRYFTAWYLADYDSEEFVYGMKMDTDFGFVSGFAANGNWICVAIVGYREAVIPYQLNQRKNFDELLKNVCPAIHREILRVGARGIGRVVVANNLGSDPPTTVRFSNQHMVNVGDARLVTNPMFGRGIALAFQSAEAIVNFDGSSCAALESKLNHWARDWHVADVAQSEDFLDRFASLQHVPIEPRPEIEAFRSALRTTRDLSLGGNIQAKNILLRFSQSISSPNEMLNFYLSQTQRTSPTIPEMEG